MSLRKIKAFGAALVNYLQQRAPTTELGCARAVKVIDGTSMPMPNAAAIPAAPQEHAQGHDRLQTWHKPAHRHQGSPWPKGAWNRPPAQIAVRVVKVSVERNGFRTTCLWLTTTLIDAKRCSRKAHAERLYRRWSR